MAVEAVVSRSGRARARIPPNAITFVLVVLVIACLAWAKPVILPAAVAILLAFILAPFVAALDRRGIPRVPAVFAVVVLAGVILGSLGTQLVQLGQFLHSQRAPAADTAEPTAAVAGEDRAGSQGRLEMPTVPLGARM